MTETDANRAAFVAVKAAKAAVQDAYAAADYDSPERTYLREAYDILTGVMMRLP